MIRVFFLVFLFSPFVFAQLQSKVIYGDDDRIDYYAITNLETLKQTHSSVLLVKNSDIFDHSDGFVELKNKSLGLDKKFCPTERFLKQPLAGFCSGFLVAPNIIATAGHCVRDEDDCEDTSVVFNYRMLTENYDPTVIDENAIFQCKKLIVSKMDTSGADFALMEIKAVNNLPVLSLDPSKPKEGDSFRVIGYPMGLPLKVAGNGKFRSNNNGYFTAALDTYSKNSGSPVINEATGSVVGILVRGESDFTQKNKCIASKVCEEDACYGEHVTYISNIIPYLSPSMD